jgi:hypothetical protein
MGEAIATVTLLIFCMLLFCSQVNTNNVTAQTRLDKRALVVYFTRSNVPNKQGTARVTCVSGCSCTPFDLDGFNSDAYATLGAGSTQVGVNLGVKFEIT